MHIRYLGHAAFLLTTPKNIRIVTDPYEPGGYHGAIGFNPIDEAADIVTVSHEHADHNHVSSVSGRPEIVRGSGRHVCKHVHITGVTTHHDAAGGRERGDNTVFVFNVDGMKVAHLGDLGHVLTAEQVRQIEEVDVALLPVGGRATVDAAAAAQVAEQLKAKIIIPMHYKTDKVGFPFAPRDDFLRGKNNVKYCNSSDVEITRDDLPSTQKIWVLDPAR